jgi:hypothetical protein
MIGLATILVGGTEIFEKQPCFSGAVFGLSLAATNAEEGSVGNQVAAGTQAPGSFYLGVGGFKLGSCWHASVTISVNSLLSELLEMWARISGKTLPKPIADDHCRQHCKYYMIHFVYLVLYLRFAQECR